MTATTPTLDPIPEQSLRSKASYGTVNTAKTPDQPPVSPRRQSAPPQISRRPQRLRTSFRGRTGTAAPRLSLNSAFKQQQLLQAKLQNGAPAAEDYDYGDDNDDDSDIVHMTLSVNGDCSTVSGLSGESSIVSSNPLEAVKVVLTVLQAKDLVPKDQNWMGAATSTDPYAIVKLISTEIGGAGETKEVMLGKTKVVWNTLNPVWEENPMKITILKDTRTQHQLQFTIMDYDTTKDDELMGVITIPLPTDEPLNAVEQWYDVPHTPANSQNGRLQLSLHTNLHSWGGTGATGRPEPAKTLQDSTTTPSESGYVDLDFTVVQGEGLAAASDPNLVVPRTPSNPYVDVVFLPGGEGGPELSLGMTTIMKKTLAPVWSEKFTTTLPLSTIRPDSQFRLTIMDHDELTRDECMGVVHIPLPSDHHDETQQTKWYDIPEASAPNASGSLQCTLKMKQRATSTTLQDQKTSPGLPTSLKKATMDSMTFGVTVFAGSDLVASDPYVKVQLVTTTANGRTRVADMGQTKTVLQSLAPVFNDSFEVTIHGRELARATEAHLQLTVFDYDITSKDYCMGILTLPIPLVAASITTPRWYCIPAYSAGNAAGRLQVAWETEITYASDNKHRRQQGMRSAHRPSMIRKTSVRTLLPPQSRDTSAFCTPRRSRPKQRNISSLVAAPSLDFSDESTVSASSNSQQRRRLQDESIRSKSSARNRSSRRRASSPGRGSRMSGSTMSGSARLSSSVVTAPTRNTSGATARQSPGAGVKALNVSKRNRHLLDRPAAHPSKDASAYRTPSNRTRNKVTTGGANGMPTLGSLSSPTERSNDRTVTSLTSEESAALPSYCTPLRSTSKAVKSESPLPELQMLTSLGEEDESPTGAERSGTKEKQRRSSSQRSPQGVTEALASPRDTPPTPASKSTLTPRKVLEQTRKVLKKSSPNMMNIKMALADEATTVTSATTASRTTVESSSEKHRAVTENEQVATQPSSPTLEEPKRTRRRRIKAQRSLSKDSVDSTDSVSSMRRRASSTIWRCVCGYESDKSRPFCGMCGKGQFWSCSDCSYEQNMCLYQFCGMCRAPRNKTVDASKHREELQGS